MEQATCILCGIPLTTANSGEYDPELGMWLNIELCHDCEEPLNIRVRKREDGYYWRLTRDNLDHGPLYNTAATKQEAYKQAEAYIRNGFK